MKKYFMYAALVGVLLSVSCVNVFADYKGFNIKAGYDYVKDSTPNAKQNHEMLMGVKWTSSGAGATHKMWFQCVNSNTENRGKGLLNRPSNDVKYIETTAKKGYNYYIRASREHITNPVTQVKGTWQP